MILRTVRKGKRETKLLEMKIFAKFWTNCCSTWELYTALIFTIIANTLMRMKCPIGVELCTLEVFNRLAMLQLMMLRTIAPLLKRKWAAFCSLELTSKTKKPQNLE